MREMTWLISDKPPSDVARRAVAMGDCRADAITGSRGRLLSCLAAQNFNSVAVLGFTFGGGSGIAIIAAGGGGTDLYCHSEPPLTSGKLCCIINFIGGTQGSQNFDWAGRLLWLLFEPLLNFNEQRMTQWWLTNSLKISASAEEQVFVALCEW